MMDKYSGVIPVGIGNTWQHFFTKCVFAVVGVDAKEAYGAEQLFRGMEAEIKGRIHMMSLMCRGKLEVWKNLKKIIIIF